VTSDDEEEEYVFDREDLGCARLGRRELEREDPRAGVGLRSCLWVVPASVE
jgi:hypothetical protein